MLRVRFSLQQLLVLVAVLAVGLLLVRSAVRNQGLAVGLLVLGIGGGVLLLLDLAVYAGLRAVGRICGLEPERPEVMDPAGPGPSGGARPRQTAF